ncbi:zinc ribbon domain-containing protein [Verrucomicrobiota bacterium]
MPIYEYQCGKCKKSFEHLARSMSDPAPKCPKCGAGEVEKQLSSFSALSGNSHDSSLPPCSSEGTCPSGGCAGGGCPLG